MQVQTAFMVTQTGMIAMYKCSSIVTNTHTHQCSTNNCQTKIRQQSAKNPPTIRHTSQPKCLRSMGQHHPHQFSFVPQNILLSAMKTLETSKIPLSAIRK